jgi:hypothetical protein
MTQPGVRFWQYYLPSENMEGWAEIVLTSTGMLAVVSDYGDYAFAWRHFGCGGDFRKFVLQIGPDYLADKLSYGRKNIEYDSVATAKKIRKLICEWRRERQVSKRWARDEWNRIEDTGALHGEYEFYLWYQGTKINDASEMRCERQTPQLVAFVEKTLPRLKRAIQIEIDQEHYGRLDLEVNLMVEASKVP